MSATILIIGSSVGNSVGVILNSPINALPRNVFGDAMINNKTNNKTPPIVRPIRKVDDLLISVSCV
ncbi:MAG: hypothetical protein B6242_12255 [Anaerolineaceae bacterium 4572_78]|nr:MAG: hypothetical protein B6242_12255 [Anaerolineaceae bacterium 4572_78]